jgi:prepilin-type N-terminal cleavage/methylation domain-containing protein
MNFEAIVATTPMTRIPIPMPRRRGRCTGFTLVEMAVVVTLIGILLAMGLAAANSVMQNTQRSVTKDRQAYVRDAMLAYFTANHRFPCPDNGSNVGNTGRDGVEDRAVGGAIPLVTSACTRNLGTVPYLTLGIAREQALDAYGNFMTYRLDTARGWHLTTTFTAPVSACFVPSSPTLPALATDCFPPAIIKTTYACTTPKSPANPQGDPAIASPAFVSVFSTPAVPQTTVAAVVLISHGANGLGAWNQGVTNASRNALPAGADELGNTQATPAGPTGYRSYIFSDAAANPFDDLLVQFGLADLQVVMLTKMGRTNICN